MRRPTLALQQLAIRVNRTEQEALEAMAVIQRGIAPGDEWLIALLETSAQMANYVDAVSEPRAREWERMAGILVEVIAKRIEERA